uniref:Myosin_tail_1 domain-containing protein n=1 Tax=Meloidogyne hapla TaxID=6305 RepID=A0A1I8BNT9_MELHA
MRNELQVEKDEIAERLDEMGRAGAEQIELNKRSEAEISRMRKEMEKSTIQNNAALQELKKKNADVTTSLSEQIELNKRSEAEISRMRKEMEKSTIQNNAALQELKKKNADVTTLSEQIELNKRSEAEISRSEAEISYIFISKNFDVFHYLKKIFLSAIPEMPIYKRKDKHYPLYKS